MARLGKRERQAKRVLFTKFRVERQAVQAVVEANLLEMRHGNVLPTSKGYGYRDMNTRMTHGLYRGLFEPELSTVLDTERGLKEKAFKSMSEKTKWTGIALAGPVTSLRDGLLTKRLVTPKYRSRSQ